MVVINLCVIVGGGEEPLDALLAKRVYSFKAPRAGISSFVETLALSYKLPVGLEVIPGEDSRKKPLTIRIDSGTVRDVFDAIVREDPRYEWKKSGEVVNVLPKTDRSAILETVIGDCRLDDVNRQDASSAIMELPEVRKALSSLESSRAAYLSLPTEPYYSLPRFSVRFRNVSVRQALNEILKTSKSTYWVFFIQSDFFSIGFH